MGVAIVYRAIYYIPHSDTAEVPPHSVSFLKSATQQDDSLLRYMLFIFVCAFEKPALQGFCTAP